MQKDFYLSLSDEVIATCEELLRLAKEWQLPIRRKENFVGFGKMHGFYMFWIARKDGVDYFKARRTYRYEQTEEPVCFPLTAENKNAILEAAKVIYREYLEHGDALCASRAPRFRHFDPREAVQTSVADPTPKSKAPIRKNPWYEAAQHAVSVWKGEAEESGPNASNEALSQAAHAFSHTVDQLLQLLSNEMRAVRTRDIWRRYVLTDAETLEQIGSDYGLTRERIRQLVRAGHRTIATLFRRCCTCEKNEGFDAYILPMTQALENIPCALPVFLQSAFSDWGEHKKKSVLQLLFGEANGAELIEACEKYQKEAKSSAKKQNGAAAKVARLQEMIRYPTEVHADAEEQISAFAMEREYAHVASFRRQLEKMQECVRFVQKPNIVYYSTLTTDHRPDFLLEPGNGRRVLVLVLPTLNMGFSYNVKRFGALRDFCESKGYGYLIVDDRGQTLWDLECLPIDPALKSALDAILSFKGEILWGDIVEVKKTHELTNSLIAAYVLQSKLYFVMNPYFCIRSFS